MSTAGKWPTAWSISREPSCAPTTSFKYGVVPSGFREWSPAQKLDDGVTYVAAFTGCGFYGGIAFKSVHGRLIYEHGAGDAPAREVAAATQ
jgi:hypothetical protein